MTSGVAAVPKRVRQALNDLFSPHFSLEVRLAGPARRPLLPQRDRRRTGRLTNLVDTHKHVFTVGLGFTFGQPSGPVTVEPQEEAWAENWAELTKDASLDLDLFFQLHWHQGPSQSKAPGDPRGRLGRRRGHGATALPERRRGSTAATTCQAL